MPTKLSVEELEAMLAQKNAEEKAAKDDEKIESIAHLENELRDACDHVASAKQARKAMIAKAREIAFAESAENIAATKEVVTAIKSRIREAGGAKASGTKGTRTKAAGFGGRKRDEVVLAVMGMLDGPVKGKDVAARIIDDGLFVGESTSLACAVSTSLNKLTVDGSVTKEGQRRSAKFELA